MIQDPLKLPTEHPSYIKQKCNLCHGKGKVSVLVPGQPPKADPGDILAPVPVSLTRAERRRALMQTRKDDKKKAKGTYIYLVSEIRTCNCQLLGYTKVRFRLEKLVDKLLKEATGILEDPVEALKYVQGLGAKDVNEKTPLEELQAHARRCLLDNVAVEAGY